MNLSQGQHRQSSVIYHIKKIKKKKTTEMTKLQDYLNRHRNAFNKITRILKVDMEVSYFNIIKPFMTSI